MEPINIHIMSPNIAPMAISYVEELVSQLQIRQLHYHKNDSLSLGIGNKETNVSISIFKIGKGYFLCFACFCPIPKSSIDISVFHRLLDYLGVEHKTSSNLKDYINVYDGFAIKNIKNYKELLSSILLKESKEIGK